ncbi:hypothetical protein [Methanimicrococcus hongohii]|uniref:hypothetical protein n=1 Tax=Methanimicrococcus hongohii TaxID=3028295 RepID=UPI00292D7CB2|nr:hypothetical protein [Methanimicrococcus sp. Hf6]
MADSFPCETKIQKTFSTFAIAFGSCKALPCNCLLLLPVSAEPADLQLSFNVAVANQFCVYIVGQFCVAACICSFLRNPFAFANVLPLPFCFCFCCYLTFSVCHCYLTFSVCRCYLTVSVSAADQVCTAVAAAAARSNRRPRATPSNLSSIFKPAPHFSLSFKPIPRFSLSKKITHYFLMINSRRFTQFFHFTDYFLCHFCYLFTSKILVLQLCKKKLLKLQTALRSFVTFPT